MTWAPACVELICVKHSSWWKIFPDQPSQVLSTKNLPPERTIQQKTQSKQNHTIEQRYRKCIGGTHLQYKCCVCLEEISQVFIILFKKDSLSQHLPSNGPCPTSGLGHGLVSPRRPQPNQPGFAKLHCFELKEPLRLKPQTKHTKGNIQETWLAKVPQCYCRGPCKSCQLMMSMETVSNHHVNHTSGQQLQSYPHGVMKFPSTVPSMLSACVCQEEHTHCALSARDHCKPKIILNLVPALFFFQTDPATLQLQSWGDWHSMFHLCICKVH